MTGKVARNSNAFDRLTLFEFPSIHSRPTQYRNHIPKAYSSSSSSETVFFSATSISTSLIPRPANITTTVSTIPTMNTAWRAFWYDAVAASCRCGGRCRIEVDDCRIEVMICGSANGPRGAGTYLFGAFTCYPLAELFS